MAENLVDSIISPLFYFGLFGLPGAAVFRAANTMDAMLGYRMSGSLGWCAARMDDILNFIPARVRGRHAAHLLRGKGKIFHRHGRGCTRTGKKDPV